MTTPPNPRDGLTDDTDTLLGRINIAAAELARRAADREARPAPASVEAPDEIDSMAWQREGVTLTAHQLAEAITLATGDEVTFSDPDMADSEVTIAYAPEGFVRDDDGKTEPAGYVAWLTDYPDEGCIPLTDPLAERAKEAFWALAASTPPAEAQPVAWEYRFFDDANPPGKWTEWERVQPRNKYMSTVMDAVREFQHYISEGYRYELRALYEGPIPVTPPASEARATGDAAPPAREARALAALFDEQAGTWFQPGWSGWRIAALLRALSDRATGDAALPATAAASALQQRTAMLHGVDAMRYPGGIDDAWICLRFNSINEATAARYAMTTLGDEWQRAALSDRAKGDAASADRAAYEGAREDLLDWKRRALRAEADLRTEQETTRKLNRALGEEVNGRTFMGEPLISDRSTGAVPAGMSLVPTEILDRFPEINPSNYDHDDACTLNAWGVELVLAATGAAGEPQPREDEAIELASALEQQRAYAIVAAVAALPIGGKDADMPTPFQAGFQLACDEIGHRLRTEVWTLGDVTVPIAAPPPQADSGAAGGQGDSNADQA